MFRIELTRAARRALSGLPKKDLRAVDAAILALAEDPRPSGCRKLRGGEELLRTRVGSYRIYRIEDEALVVLVVRIGHRKEAYRRS